MNIISTFPVTRTVAPVLRRIGLDPACHEGAAEVIDTLFKLHFEPMRPNMARDDYQEGVARSIDYWAFQVDAARDYAQPFFQSGDAIGDPVFCALIGGIDLLVDAQTRDWQSHAARNACQITREAVTIQSPSAFMAACPEAQFIAMMDVYCDLNAQAALMRAMPERFTNTPLSTIDGVGMAHSLEFPASKLGDAIGAAEQKVAEIWRSVYNPRKGATLRPV